MFTPTCPARVPTSRAPRQRTLQGDAMASTVLRATRSPTVSRNRGARDRRWARLSSRRVAPKPARSPRDRERQGDADRPHASSVTHGAPSQRRAVPATRRACRGDPCPPPNAGSAVTSRSVVLTAALPSAASIAAKYWCTRGCSGAAHKRRKPKPGWLGLLVVVGHSGLEPEANGLRIHC